MEVKLACMTLPYSELPFERAREGIACAGYEYVAYGWSHQGAEVPDPLGGPDEVAEIRRKVEDAGLETVLLTAPGGGLTDDEGVTKFQRRMEQARELGCRFLLAHGPWEYESWPDKKHPPERWKEMTDPWFEAMTSLARDAESLGAHIVLKPHTGTTASGAVLRETIERIGSDAVRVCYDGGNVHFYEGLDPVEDIKICADLVEAICVKDHKGPRANPLFPCPGEGDVDHPGMLRVLKEYGFNGPCCVERFEGPHKKAEMPPELLDRLAGETLEYLRGAVAEI